MAISQTRSATCPVCGWCPEQPVSPPPCPDSDPPVCPWFLDDAGGDATNDKR